MITFIIGLVIGCWIGIVLMCMLVMAKRADLSCHSELGSGSYEMSRKHSGFSMTNKE